jgi:hypothetical protein
MNEHSSRYGNCYSITIFCDREIKDDLRYVSWMLRGKRNNTQIQF